MTTEVKETSERTVSSSTTEKKVKPSNCRACNVIVIWLEDPTGALNAYGKTRRLPFGVNAETGASTGIVHRCKQGLEAWKAELQVQVEKDKQAGKSASKPCSKCKKLIYWSYERLSKNGRPLPINDDGSGEYHQCPFFTPAGKK